VHSLETVDYRTGGIGASGDSLRQYQLEPCPGLCKAFWCLQVDFVSEAREYPGMRNRCRLDRLPLNEGMLVCVTLSFATFLAYEFTLFSAIRETPHRPQYIDLDEALVLAVLFCFGLLFLSWRYFCAQRSEATRRRASEQRALRLAERDALTGLPNRLSFERAIRDVLGPEVSPAASHVVVLLDIKDFRRINDTFGHGCGDEVLTRVSKRLQREHRGGLVARLGNDEFGLLLTDLSNAEQATSLAFSLTQALHRPMLIRDISYELEVGIGVACIPQDGRDDGEILRKAEIALHRAMAAPGASLCFFEPAMDLGIREHAILERDLRAAIAEGAVQAFYQPIVDLGSRRLIGFEALARWTHPELGAVSPDRFIRVAERCGLMDTLSEHLLRQAARVALAWPEHVRLAFNISSAQLNSQAWPQRLLLVLEECGLVPQRVEVEVTETALVQDLHRAQQALATLRGGGARIALDDFGTGTSSLHHLREFKVDELKIDRGFVGAVLCDPGAAALIRGVIGLAHGLDLKVTAEGVEQQEQAAALLALQCDQAQGYLYGAALSAAEAASLAQNDWVESSPAAQAKAGDAGV